MLVYPCGAHVRIGNSIDGEKGVITGILIRDSRVEYEVAWWVKGERKQTWVSCFEVTPDSHHSSDVNMQEIGFHSDKGVMMNLKGCS